MNFMPDRHLAVPPGTVVRTGYVDIFRVRPACRERMAVGDVGAAFQKVLQAGKDQFYPCPFGYWSLSDFILVDGRHEWLARIMHGNTHILVAWLE